MITSRNDSTIALPDLAATDKLATNLAQVLMPGLIIYLHGDLGAGKTTLVRALLTALGRVGVTKSPTYTLVETYTINTFTINHFDLYRLADPAELDFIGIRDYITPNSICFFEWPKRGHGHIPTADLEITLQFTRQGRTAALQANTPAGEKLLQAVTRTQNE